MTLALGLVLDAGATLVGVAIVTGVLSLVALADGTLKRLQARRTSPDAR